MFTTMVRLVAQRGAMLHDLEEEYSLEQLGGQIPNVGDIIISPWMSNPKTDIDEPSKRTFYEVVQRYIHPKNPKDPDKYPDQEVFIYISVEVLERSGTEKEQVLCR